MLGISLGVSLGISLPGTFLSRPDSKACRTRILGLFFTPLTTSFFVFSLLGLFFSPPSREDKNQTLLRFEKAVALSIGV